MSTPDRQRFELVLPWNESRTIWNHWKFVDTAAEVERARRECPCVEVERVTQCGACRDHRPAHVAACAQCAYNREHLARVRAERAALAS